MSSKSSPSYLPYSSAEEFKLECQVGNEIYAKRIALGYSRIFLAFKSRTSPRFIGRVEALQSQLDESKVRRIYSSLNIKLSENLVRYWNS